MFYVLMKSRIVSHPSPSHANPDPPSPQSPNLNLPLFTLSARNLANPLELLTQFISLRLEACHFIFI